MAIPQRTAYGVRDEQRPLCSRASYGLRFNHNNRSFEMQQNQEQSEQDASSRGEDGMLINHSLSELYLKE